MGALLVLAGGLVTSPLPESSWAATLPPRGFLPGRMAGLTVVVTGLGALAAAWLRVYRAACRGEAGVGDVRRLTATWCLPLLAAPPLFSRDGWSYAAQAVLTREGLSPYVWGPAVLDGPIAEAVDPRWADTPAPYGPLPLLLGSYAARLTEDPWSLVVAHRLLALVGLALLAWALPRLAAWSGVDGAVASAMVLPSPLVLAHGVGGLHNDLLMVGLAAAALAVGRDHGWQAGAAMAGLAAAVKLPGGLAALGVVLLSLPAGATPGRRLARFAGAASIAVGTLLAVGVVAGVGHGWVHALDVPATILTPLSLSATLEPVLAGSRTVGLALAAGVLAWLGLHRPTGSPGGAVRTTATAVAALLLLGPVVHAWYALWCLPLWAACRLRRRGTAAVLWLSTALGVAAPLDSSLEGAPVALALTTMLVLGTVAALTRGIRPAAPPVPAIPAP